MNDEIQWVTPPERVLNQVRKTPYTDIAAALRRRPGQWALLPGERASKGTAGNLAQNIRRGTMKDFPKGHFEAVSDDTQVYARCVKEEGDDPGSTEVSTEVNEDSAAIRAWAKENGWPDLADRGNLSAKTREAYAARLD